MQVTLREKPSNDLQMLPNAFPDDPKTNRHVFVNKRCPMDIKNSLHLHFYVKNF